MPQFRKEATQAHRQHAEIFGDVILTSPIHHRVYAACGVALGLGLILLLIFGQYSRRISVPGQLLPEQGVIRLYAQSAGTVAAAYASEGDQVASGAVLFQLANPRYGSDGGDTHGSLMGTISSRYSALKEEMRSTEAIQAHELTALRTRLANLEKQKENLARQRGIAVERQRIAQEGVDKFVRLAATGFVSSEQVLQKQSTLLDQSQAIAMLDKQTQELDEQLSGAHKELLALPLKQGNARSALFRSYQEVQQEMVEQTASKGSAVVAPVAGKLTAVMAKPGNVVTPGHVLGTLIPEGARLQANLYVPSQGIGFITPGAKVYLRYRAFPYQKFGQAAGTVLDISAASIRPDELDDSARSTELSAAGRNEPVYRVRVRLDSQDVQAQGRAIPLLAGALLDADIMLDRKPLYQWVLDPVGKFLTSQNP